MRLPDDELETPLQINIVPMIDVIFAILTFFIMSSLYLSQSASLPINLPKAVTADPQSPSSQTPVTVTIDAQGNIALESQRVDLKDLTQRLQAMMGNQATVVVLSADAAVDYGQVVAVMDQIRTIPGVRLAIAAERPN